MSRTTKGIGRQTRAAGVRRFRAQLVLIAVLFSALLYAGLYTQLRSDAMNALGTEGASYANLLLNIGGWTSWHSSGEILSERADDGTSVTYHLVDLNAPNPAFRPDGWEELTLTALYDGESSAARIEETDAGRVYRYMEPVRIRESCLECHDAYSPGEQRGALSLEIPMASVDTRLSRGRAMFATVAAFTLMGMLGIGSLFLGMFQRNLDAANERLEAMAVTDELTGAPNRRAVIRRFEDEFERSRRTGEPLSVILIDIDEFKIINDTFGHAVGDVVLIEVVRRALDSLRSYDTFGRMGGEEFLVVAPGTASQTAERLTERLLESLRTLPVNSGEHDIMVTASAGVATLKEDDAGIDAMLARADEALYRAKDEGRNRFVSAR